MIVTGLNLNQKRTTIQLVTITRTDREGLAAPDRQKIRTIVVQPIKPAFSTNDDLIKQTNQGHTFLANSLDFQKQVKSLKMQLTAYSVSDVFKIYELDGKGQPINEKLILRCVFLFL